MLAASCRRLGYRMDRFVVGPSEKEQKALSRILKARGIRAVLIYGENSEVRDWSLDWKNFAAVTFSGSMREHFVHNVMSSSYQDVYDAVARLAERGYKKPGYFISKQDFDHWQIGFRAAMNLIGRKSSRALCIRDKSMSEKTVREKFIAWYEKYQPDLVVSSYAQGYAVLKKCGVKIPEDTGYFSLDAQPHLNSESGLVQLRDVAYKAAVDLLHGMILRHEYGPPRHPICMEIPSEWNEGKTLRSL
jgi:LacI family transcriptional regulator